MTGRCPRCGAVARYLRYGERVALCGYPVSPCTTRLPGAFEREVAAAVRPRVKEEQCKTLRAIASTR